MSHLRGGWLLGAQRACVRKYTCCRCICLIVVRRVCRMHCLCYALCDAFVACTYCVCATRVLYAVIVLCVCVICCATRLLHALIVLCVRVMY